MDGGLGQLIIPLKVVFFIHCIHGFAECPPHADKGRCLLESLFVDQVAQLNFFIMGECSAGGLPLRSAHSGERGAGAGSGSAPPPPSWPHSEIQTGLSEPLADFSLCLNNFPLFT